MEEMDRFLEECNLPRLNQDKIEIMKTPFTSTEIETVIKNLPNDHIAVYIGMQKEIAILYS